MPRFKPIKPASIGSMKQFHIRLDPDDMDALQAAARKLDTAVSVLTRRIVADWVAKYRKVSAKEAKE